MIDNRKQLMEYARKICLNMLDYAALRHEKDIIPTVIDNMGYVPTFLEEFCRPWWGLAPVVAQSEDDIYINVKGENAPLYQWLSDILFEGLQEGGEKSWERYRYCGAGWGLDFQNVTELAGLLTGLYFCKEKTWDLFSPSRRKLFADRIYTFCKGECEHPAENNHIWFPLLCILVLKKFGYNYADVDEYLQKGMDELEKMYLSEGWYSDGAFGRFDYYQVWSMHFYPMLWCVIEDESFPHYTEFKTRYTERTGQFIEQYIYCFDEKGAFPPFGRSLAYKFAAVSIFSAAALAGCEIDYALARKITLKNISYFEENMQLSKGILPTGYLYEAPALVENYTSDGGAYWCTKAFICLLLKENHPFWTAEDKLMPIEKGDYLVKPRNNDIHFAVYGSKKCGVTVYNNISQYYQHGIYNNPFNDMAAYYCKFAYNSRSGFAIGTRDRVSFDNMISLETPDESMRSHRWGFRDLGTRGDVMLSSHVPFSNDSGTNIQTALLPLRDGSYVRLHRVNLSQPYYVREGGFSIGLYSDYHTQKQQGQSVVTENGELYSYFSAVATVPVDFSHYHPQPGLHILSPHACYPGYKSEILPQGTYYFACSAKISTQKDEKLPVLCLEADKLIVKNGENTWEIPFNILED